jgi:hypothetical protein
MRAVYATHLASLIRSTDMDLEEDARAAALPGRAVWFALVMTLLCIAAVPAFWFLADSGLLAWNAGELRWSQLRAARNDGAGVDAHDFVELYRQGCFGECPVYRVTLFASGRVEYAGEQFVCENGLRTSVVDARTAAKLISDIRDAGFFEIHWSPTDDVSDNPEVFTRLAVSGAVRLIRNYHGDLSAPRLLRKFEDEIDEVAGTDQWVPARSVRGRICPDGRRPRI